MLETTTIESANFVTILIAFGFGGLSFVSPCVLPLLPGYLSLMSGYSVSDLQEGKGSTRRMARVTSLFVLGFTAVFVLWGVFAQRLGSTLNQNWQTITLIAGWVVIVFGMVVLASSFTGTAWIQNILRERKLEIRPSKLGPWAPPVMGFAFGFAWTPCVGPILGSIILVAGSSDTAGDGIILLLAYSAGLGIPFLLSSLAMTKFLGAVRALRKHLRTINVISGVALISFGVLMITNQLFVLSSRVSTILQDLGLDWLAAI